MKRLVPIGFCVAALLGIVLWIAWFRLGMSTREQPADPYTDLEELASDITLLPKNGTTTQTTSDDWEPYVHVARRIKSTDPRVTRSALGRLKNARQAAFITDVKVMLLLRICFECPTNRPPLFGAAVGFPDRKPPGAVKRDA